MRRIILTENARYDAPPGDGLWLGAAEILRITGWMLKPEGMCRGDVCVPLPAAARREGAADLAAFWALMGAPVVGSDSGDVWSLGVAPDDRRAALETLGLAYFECTGMLMALSHTTDQSRNQGQCNIA